MKINRLLIICMVLLVSLVSFVYATNYIVISEVLYDPSGTDLGYEFIELYNPTNTTINVSGLKIQSGGVSWKTTAILPNQQYILPYGFYLVGENETLIGIGLDYETDLDFQNGGNGVGPSDGVRILNFNNETIDTLLYDIFNINLFPSEGDPAPDVESGHSLERKPGYLAPNCGNWQDTNNNSNDFLDNPNPEPQNSQNKTEVPCNQTFECTQDSDCNDANTCTNDNCNLTTHTCRHANNNNPCNDGNACATNDQCSNGVCIGVSLNCNDSNVCTNDACNNITGCYYINNSNTCNDGKYCTVSDQCNGGMCNGNARDCSANNIGGIAKCNNNPDNNSFTWDYFAGFTSVCDEVNDKCTNSTITLTYTCDKAKCSAECENDNDCNATDCGLDGCVGDDYYDYNDMANTCEGCVCTDNQCGQPIIYQNDSRCMTIACQEDNDCNYLNKDYCNVDSIMHDKGICVDNECGIETTTVEDCNDNDTIYCEGTLLKEEEHTCSNAVCVMDLISQDCNNSLYCDGAGRCENAQCIAGIPVNCSAYDLAGIAACNNNPDNEPFTWDYFAGFTSVCDEVNDRCTNGTTTLTHSCDKARCGAGCERDMDCGQGYKCKLESCSCVSISEFYCGDGAINGNEVCDGANLSGKTCQNFGYTNPNTLICNSNCSGFDTSGCKAVCGNNALELGEECDDGNLIDGDGCSSLCEIEESEIIDDLQVNYLRGRIRIDGENASQGTSYKIEILTGDNAGKIYEGMVDNEKIPQFLKGKGYFDSGDQIIFTTDSMFRITSGDCNGSYEGKFLNGGNGDFINESSLIDFSCNISPVIRDVYHLPSQPTETDNVTIFANATDNFGVDTAMVSYSVNNGSNITQKMNFNVIYYANLGAFNKGDTIKYKVIANDSYGNYVISDIYYIVIKPGDKDGDGYKSDVDCNDSNALIHLGATEICNLVDDDCDGSIDEEGASGCTPYYKDVDMDGYGLNETKCLCLAYYPYNAAQDNDCNDNNVLINPAATEICNGVDDNCNGKIDEGFPNFDNDSMADCVDPDSDNDGHNNSEDAYPNDTIRWFLGDVNGDGGVNLADLVAVRRAFGIKPGDSRWNELYDLNKDRKISLADLMIIRRHFT